MTNQSVRLFLSIMIFSTGCSSPKSESGLNDIATASRFKTGMFMPERGLDLSNGYQKNMPTTISAASLAEKLGISLKVGIGQDLYVVPTYEGDQLLIFRQAEARPIPVGGISRAGVPFYLGAFMTTKEGSNLALVGSTYFQTKTSSEKPKGVVSPDGNDSNMYLPYQVFNSQGHLEDYLVSYLNVLETVGGTTSFRLIKIGNNIVESRSGESVLEFRELGNQVWRVYGGYKDSYMKHGSVLWSPDMKTYYSIRESGASIVRWRKQDNNSMDILEKNAIDAVVPTIVRDLLNDRSIIQDTKRLALTGPINGTTARSATSLIKRPVAAGNSAFSLSQQSKHQQISLFLSSEDAYHRFFETEARDDHLALGGDVAPEFSGINQYPSGARVAVPGGISGTVIGATVVTTKPGGYFTSEQMTKVTYIKTDGGAIRELTSTNSGEVEQRILNSQDILNMKQQNSAILTSPEQAKKEDDFRASMQKVNTQAQTTVDSANAFGNKYGTAQGIATNVLLPVATLGAADSVGKKYAGEALGNLGNEAVKSAGGLVTTTASYLVDGDKKSATDSIMGNAAQSGTSVLGAAFDVNAKVGAATAGATQLGMEALKAAETGKVDLAKSALSVGAAALGDAADVALPGASVAVGVAADAGGVFIDSARTGAAEAESNTKAADYYAPIKTDSQLDQVLANTEAPST